MDMTVRLFRDSRPTLGYEVDCAVVVFGDVVARHKGIDYQHIDFVLDQRRRDTLNNRRRDLGAVLTLLGQYNRHLASTIHE